MKKTFLLSTILLISIISTACVNNLAVQTLNENAQKSINSGDTESAICKLKSSLDLDENFFETNYNLAIAYIKLEDYENAKNYLLKAIELKPDFPDCYYSLALTYEEIAIKKINNITEQITQEENGEQIDDFENDDDIEIEFSPEDKTFIIENYNNSIKNFKIYLQKNAIAEDKADVENKILQLEKEIEKYSEQYHD